MSLKRQATGYIHQVSPLKKSAKKSTEFFTATLQQESDYKKIVVFSPQKHQALKVQTHILKKLIIHVVSAFATL